MGLAKPGTTHGLTGTGPRMPCHDAAGWGVGRFWIRTEPFLQSEPTPLAGYLDPLLTLLRTKDLSKALQETELLLRMQSIISH